MTGSRKRLILQAEEVTESVAYLRSQLRLYQDAVQRFVDHVERGETVLTAAHNANVARYRQLATEAIEGFESARRQMRLALFALGQEEGASISQLGRALGVSRQLASRIAADAAEELE